MSTFLCASKIYENTRVSQFNSHEIQSQPIAHIMRDSSQLFKILDHSDSAQADISLRLWLLRSSVLFTLLPFNDASLGLKNRMEELSLSSKGLPEAALFIQSIEKAVDELIECGTNIKRRWLLNTTNNIKSFDGVGILCALSFGKTPGWPVEASLELTNLLKGVKLIGSKKDLRSGVFERIILPCACRNVSPLLLAEIIYAGRTKVIDALLYPDEKFSNPKRLVPPVGSIFKGKLQKQTREYEVHVVREINTVASVDTWMNDVFWQKLHGGSRSASASLVSANYVLFRDGSGTFLPENGRVPILPETVDPTNISDLRLVPVENVCEGDLVVLRAGDSSFLLDEASDQIMNNAGVQNLVDEATDWKSALDALLLTQTCEEISQSLRERGVSISPMAINHWSGPDVLGPGSERAFKALIGLLGDRGKLSENCKNISEYAESRWTSLRELRGIRHRAGNQIRQELLTELFSRLGSDITQLADRTSIHIEGDSGVELLILRVSAVDQNSAFVPPSRLCRLDDLRGNKWLG
jgi:hypothetical protein